MPVPTSTKWITLLLVVTMVFAIFSTKNYHDMKRFVRQTTEACREKEIKMEFQIGDLMKTSREKINMCTEEKLKFVYQPKP